MRDWEKHFKEFNDLLREIASEKSSREAKLRFNCSFVKASDIAEQYFCEKKLDMQYLHGRVETEEKSLGAEAHEKLLEDTTRVRIKDLWQMIYGKKPIFVHEMLIFAKYKEVALAGIPDCILFVNGFPKIIFEYKFSKRGTIFNTYQVQVRTYGILLGHVGFDVSRLYCAVVVAEPGARHDKKLKDKVVNEITKNGPKEGVLIVSGAKIYIWKFDGVKAEQDLDWALRFWKKQREAIPTENLNKCASCEYSSECREPDQQRTLN